MVPLAFMFMCVSKKSQLVLLPVTYLLIIHIRTAKRLRVASKICDLLAGLLISVQTNALQLHVW